MFKFIKRLIARLTGTSTNAKKNQQNKDQSFNELVDKQITDRENIEGTPFWIQRVENKWFITLKGYALTPRFNTKDEAMKYIWLENHGWNVIGNMIIIIHEEIANQAAAEFEKRQKITGAAKSYMNRDTGDAESNWPEESYPTKKHQTFGNASDEELSKIDQENEQALKERKYRNLGEIN